MERPRRGTDKRRARKKSLVLALPVADPPRAAPVSIPIRCPPEPGNRGEPRWWGALPAGLPVLVSAVNHGFPELGLAVVILARRLGQHALVGHFVVDLLARGLTECEGEVLALDELGPYIDELDGRMPMISVTPLSASSLVLSGVRLGRDNGLAPLESLAFWGGLLEPEAEERDARDLYAPPGRPMAVADLLVPMKMEANQGSRSDQREPRCVIRQPSLREQ